MHSVFSKKKGFTLIELLVVIAVISLLSSVVFASLNSARAKARDAKAIQEFRQVSVALALYFDKYGKYPNEIPVGSSPWEINFNSMTGQLVAENFLAAVPLPPANHVYRYVNYGNSLSDIGQKSGALLVTILEATQPSTTGLPGSCRPWNANWCSSTTSSNYYCICNLY